MKRGDSRLALEARCPKCGATLITDGKSVWCTFVGDGGHGGTACNFSGPLLVTTDSPLYSQVEEMEAKRVAGVVEEVLEPATDDKGPLVRLRLENMGRMAPSLAGLDLDEVAPERAGGAPTIVCLCGSTRFGAAFRQANLEETLAGRIVLTIGCDMRSDAELFAGMDEEVVATVQAQLVELHLRKIDLSDEVLILNVGGYIGQSTSRELAYVRRLGKRVRFLEPHED